MKTLEIPRLNAEEVYTQIKKNSKNTENIDKRDRLENLEALVFKRYKEYENLNVSLELISGSTISDRMDKEALGSCYSRNKSGYLEGEVVSKILSIQSAQHKNSCPYCGIDKPRTIDHYLPKSDFPEFSIYPPNLIPCCGRCNSKKNDRWLENGERLFLNFYFDSIPNVRFLTSKLVYSSDEEDKIPTVVFELIKHSEIQPKQYELIERHFKKLELLEEYSEAIEEELSNIHDLVIHNKTLSMEDHRENLRMQARMFARKYGVNYWRACLYDAVISSDEFFDRIC